MTRLLSLLACVILSAFAIADDKTKTDCSPLLQHEFTLLHDVKTENLCDAHRGKVLLVVNTASRCGFTPQLEGLETMYRKYKDRGFAVLGFPSNDFFQEFSDEKETASFCKENYGVSFPMYSTSPVRGDDANPFYRELIAQSGTSPKWNFYKYLIDRNGKVVDVFSSRVTPGDNKLTSKIESLLEQPQ